MPTTDLEPVSQAKCFGGTQWVFRHASRETGTAMKFAAFIPPQAASRPLPVLSFLPELTCTEANVTVKEDAQRVSDDHGIAHLSPATILLRAGDHARREQSARGNTTYRSWT